AGGSLGTMIPPSVVVVIYASVAQMSVGQLFAGILLPGVIMIGLFRGYIVIRCVLRPEDGPPAVSKDDDTPLGQKLWVTLTALLPATGLIVAVLGSIMVGIASPAEAASVGALGAIVLTVAYGRFNTEMAIDTLKRTLLINCMIMMIVVGGTMFAAIFQVHGGHRLVGNVVDYLDLAPAAMLVMMLLIVFLAGFILDWVSVVLICLPIFLPLIKSIGVDPIWFAVLMIIVIQTSYLTPPMAPSIFYLRSIAPPEIGYRDMYMGVAPFVVCQVLVLVLVVLFPALAEYLPAQFSAF
ncbi:MAG: TRAP transporter large permease subunit, partial [Minwuiales bacterium]|nr:TRAP transporter large permease subunit [Minwuiales bacterium]